MHIILRNADGEQTFEVHPRESPDTTVQHLAEVMFASKLNRASRGDLTFQLYFVAAQ